MGMEDGNQLYEFIIENCLSLIPHHVAAKPCRVNLYLAKTLGEDNVDFARQGQVEVNACFAWVTK